MCGHSTMRTLILDDEEPIVHMLAKVCEKEGHIVFPFTQSVDALIYLASQPVDLLITDMHMPEHDGMTVIREARRLQPGRREPNQPGRSDRHRPIASIHVGLRGLGAYLGDLSKGLGKFHNRCL